MLRTCSRIIALTAMVAALPTTVRAADETLTLACQGTTTVGNKDLEDKKPEPVSMGIIVNFKAGTIQGFVYPNLVDHPVKMTGVNDVTVTFGGSHETASSRVHIMGSIDRITGDVWAFSGEANAQWQPISSTFYTLKCRPAQRMF
jgi:hypothetical protein